MDFIKDGSDAQVFTMKPLSSTETLALQDVSFGKTFTTSGRFEANFKLSVAQLAILERLADVYSNEFIDSTLRPILTQESKISLRSLDWLCTNFAKRTNLSCTTKLGTNYNIHQGYKISLAHFRRRNFDPFRRRLRILVRHPNGDLTTTIGQLNYLAWCDAHGILDFAEKHVHEIEKDMCDTTTKSRRRKKAAMESGHSLRRNELTKAPPARITVYEGPARVAWDTQHRRDQAATTRR